MVPEFIYIPNVYIPQYLVISDYIVLSNLNFRFSHIPRNHGTVFEKALPSYFSLISQKTILILDV